MRQLIRKIKQFFAQEEVEVFLPKHTVPFSELDAWLEQRLLQNAKSVTETAQPILEKIDDFDKNLEEDLEFAKRTDVYISALYLYRTAKSGVYMQCRIKELAIISDRGKKLNVENYNIIFSIIKG